MPIQIYRKFPLQKLKNKKKNKKTTTTTTKKKKKQKKKNKKKQTNIKISDIIYISAQNIDLGYSLEPPRRGGSNGYPQSMSLSRNKKKNYTPVNASFTI